MNKTVTILFADMVQSTERIVKSKRGEDLDTVQQVKNIYQPIVDKFKGRIVKNIGDGFMSVFDSPTDAVLTGKEFQLCLSEHNKANPEDRFLFRLGLNTGEVSVDDSGDVFGEPVNVASRIESICNPGGVYLSTSTFHAMNKAEITTREVGFKKLKGIPAKIQIYKVDGLPEEALKKKAFILPYLIITALFMVVITGITQYLSKDTSPLPILRITNVRELPRFWNNAMEKASVLYQDGANPVLYPGGALWSFGDSFLGTWREDGTPEYIGGLANTLLCVNNDGTNEYLADSKGIAKPVIPLESPETWEKCRIWPAAGIFLRGTFYLYYSLIHVKEKGLGFEERNIHGLVRSKDSWKSWERVATSHPFPFREPPSAIVRSPSGLLYLYLLEKVDLLKTRVRLARVHENNIENPDEYDICSIVLLEENGIGQVSVCWNDYLGCYVMVHVGDILSNPQDIYLRIASAPDGPFSHPVRFFGLPGSRELGQKFKQLAEEYKENPERIDETIDLKKEINGLVYCAYLHPELFRENGRIMTLTYCIAGEQQMPYLIEFEVRRP